jgi:hypothetical protein
MKPWFNKASSRGDGGADQVRVFGVLKGRNGPDTSSVISMKQICTILSLALLSSGVALAQSSNGPVTITKDDMFNQVGQYYRAYSNPYDLSSASTTNFVNPTPYQVPSNLIGSAGPSQIWDFSTGPTNFVYRFDYLAATNPVVADPADYPQATLVEHQTDESTGNTQDLYFSEDPSQGRWVYGFSSDGTGFDYPANAFFAPINDFPATIAYLQTWKTSAVWTNSQSAFGIPVGLKIDSESTLTADAWGTIVLPSQLGTFGPGLRIKEVVTQLSYFDQNAFSDTGAAPSWVLEETDNSINYYWLMPGKGIVASLASTAGANGAVPPDNFSTATQFWRMFETNHKPASTTGGGCATPDPVSDLSIQVSNGQALLKWSKANCATQYRLDYSSNPVDPNSWQTLTTVTNQLLFLDSAQNSVRFYRVVSIK